MHTLTRPLLRSPAEGADTIVWLAAATEAGEISGELFLDRESQPLHFSAQASDPPAEVEKLLDYLADFDPVLPDLRRSRRKAAG